MISEFSHPKGHFIKIGLKIKKALSTEVGDELQPGCLRIHIRLFPNRNHFLYRYSPFFLFCKIWLKNHNKVYINTPFTEVNLNLFSKNKFFPPTDVYICKLIYFSDNIQYKTLNASILYVLSKVFNSKKACFYPDCYQIKYFLPVILLITMNI